MAENMEAGPKNNTGKILGISVGLIVGCGVVLVVLPICVIILLALLGPAIGDVFSGIILDI